MKNISKSKLGSTNLPKIQNASLPNIIVALLNENKALQQTNKTLHNLMVSGEKRGQEKAEQALFETVSNQEMNLAAISEKYAAALKALARILEITTYQYPNNDAWKEINNLSRQVLNA